MKWLYIGLIVLSIAVQLFIQGPNLWWDEAVYVGLAENLPDYSLDERFPVESFRPPLLPALLAVTGPTTILMAVLSVLALLSTYYLARPYGTRTALVTTLLLSTSFFFILFFTKFLTESLFIIFLSLSLLALKRGSHRYLALAGILVGFAFLTRYFAVILLLAYIVTLLLQRRSPLAFLGGFFVMLIPWMLLGQAAYGSPIAGFFTNLDVYSVSATQSFGEGLLQLASIWTWVTPLVLGFFYLFRTQLRAYLPLVVVTVLSLGFFLVGPHKETRYLLSFFPVYGLLAALALERLRPFVPQAKILIPLVVAVLSLTTLGLGTQATWQDNQASALVDASVYLRENTAAGDVVLTQSYPFVYVLADRIPLTYCSLESQARFNQCQFQLLHNGFDLATLQATIQEHEPTYVLSYAFEPANPVQIREYLDQEFEEVARFGEWENPQAVVIYRT